MNDFIFFKVPHQLFRSKPHKFYSVGIAMNCLDTFSTSYHRYYLNKNNEPCCYTLYTTPFYHLCLFYSVYGIQNTRYPVHWSFHCWNFEILDDHRSAISINVSNLMRQLDDPVFSAHEYQRDQTPFWLSKKYKCIC